MPLYIRDLGTPLFVPPISHLILTALLYLGMGLATSVLWLFYFLIGVTWPSYVRDFKSFGAFLWYSVWCIIGFFLIYLWVSLSFSHEPSHSLLTCHRKLRAGNKREGARGPRQDFQRLFDIRFCALPLEAGRVRNQTLCTQVRRGETAPAPDHGCD
jgi:hypothetical protein